MYPFLNPLLIVAIFFLRCGVPLIVVLVLAFFLRRLDARWEAEARSQRAASDGMVIGAPTEQSSTPAPAAPPPAVNVLGISCWQIKGCDPITMSHCPASHEPHVLCWQARRQAEGRIPIECYHCELYRAIDDADSPQITQQSQQQVHDARVEV